MKHLLFSFLFPALSFYANAQTGNKVVIGTIDSIDSKILNEKRKVWIYVPNNGSDDLYSKQHYPVVYLLDGDAHFSSVVGMIQQLSSVNGNTICPEMIVVGIPNTDRTRDLTPTHVISDLPFVDSNFSKNSGGGEKFTSFIEKELMPHIDSLYPTLPYRVLIGHSFGGLTVMNTLIHHTNLFNAYIAIDPSMWWDNKKLLTQTKQVLANKPYQGVSLLLGIANTMNAGMDTAQAQKDTTISTKHIRSILELNKYLRRNPQNKLSYQYKYYNDDDHSSVPLIAEYDALHFIFGFYKLKLTGAEYGNINKALITKIEKHYDTVSTHFGFKVSPPENMTNGFAYQALGMKHYEEAEYLFKLNVANYPGSYNVYDSLGDYFEAKGDKASAIDNFNKALTIKEVADTRKKLEKLQGK
ncbi:MAG: alpha/beta hydrolase-fold protein [Ferruginibacter sp.]